MASLRFPTSIFPGERLIEDLAREPVPCSLRQM